MQLNRFIRTTELEQVLLVNDIGKTAFVYRTKRNQLGGGFGNKYAHPYTWALAIEIEGVYCGINSARGKTREWNNLDRLEVWLRQHGFRQFRVVNSLEKIKTWHNEIF